MLLTMLLLLIAAIDDLMTRKVHNVLLASYSVLALVLITHTSGTQVLPESFFGALAGFALYLPLAWFGVVGGGDLKLLAVVGLCAGSTNTILIGTIALGWGVIIGFVQVLSQKQINSFLFNLKQMSFLIAPEQKTLHRIPYVVAMFFAGVTTFTLRAAGWMPW